MSANERLSIRLHSVSGSVDGAAAIVSGLVDGADHTVDRVAYACGDLLKRLSDELDAIGSELERMERAQA